MTFQFGADSRGFRAAPALAALLLCGAAGHASAQAASALAQLADRGPTFYASSDGHRVTVDVRSVPLLQQQIAIDLSDVPLPDAIDAVAQAAHVQIVYSGADVPATRHVTLGATRITVAGALRVVLEDAALDVRISPQGTLSLVRRDYTMGVGGVGHQARATIEGQVTDSISLAPLPLVVVRVERAGQSAVTGNDGRYKIANVAQCTCVVVARRLGYRPIARTVTVGEDSIVRLDFRLPVAPAELDEVVSTVTGDESKKQLGNSISTLGADSIVKTTAVPALSDVLNARVAGLQVFNEGGLVGASPVINIRGQSTLELGTQPLLYVDGVRVDNSPAGLGNNVGGLASGRFNDIIPEEIESIEVVKGPSAATLYGTDAANGVIVVRTKRGVAGPQRWTVYGGSGIENASLARVTDSYHGWGHTTDGSNTPVNCTLLMVAARSCVQDSITRFNPVLTPGLTPYGTGNRENAGLQISGGSRDARYFVSGDYTSEIGYLTMPQVDLAMLRAERGALGVSNDEIHPNGALKYGGRENLVLGLGSNAEATIAASYLSNTTRIPNATALAGGANGPGFRDANDGWGAGGRPLTEFVGRNDQTTPHVTASGTLTWHPFGWLGTRGTFGIDNWTTDQDYYIPYQEGPPNDPGGTRATIKSEGTRYTAEGNATATFNLADRVRSSTSVGVSYFWNRTSASGATTSSQTEGCVTVLCGLGLFGYDQNAVSAVTGSYFEQQLAIAERLFVTGAVRVDGATSFGNDFHAVVYPKASISWLISDEPFFPHPTWLTSVRLRSAYGFSGTQPGPYSKLTLEQIATTFVDGAVQPGATTSSIGNAGLQPEEQREYEGGVDIDVWHSRVALQATYYTKTATNVIETLQISPSLPGAESFNIGTVANWGYEAQVSARLLDARAMQLDLSLNGSINHNQLVRLNSALGHPSPSVVPDAYPFLSQGYALWSYFGRPIQYSGGGTNGIADSSAVTFGPERYLGTSTPIQQLTMAPVLALPTAGLTVRALFDYRGQFKLVNFDQLGQCTPNPNCSDAVDPRAPIADQVRYIAYLKGDESGYLEDGTFLRFREVSLTYSLSARVASALHARSASISLAARNLAIWTNFRGLDPESGGAVAGYGGVANYAGTGSGYVPNHTYLVQVSLGF